ncbi:GlxA family transcriptional regulator [Dongia sedimenti]|uniref:GlxA family transcriptional regulator n=1 Tax=Dongia sedimenti TaxID=3064282 RepID=A0ABU0YN49_9PROT|nr:GlxA family transcriptional regulator [Rhodospirillaceae bacterium R-7]
MAPTPHDIGLLLLPSCSHLALGAVVEPLFIANWLTGRSLYRWRTLSLDGRTVRTASQLPIPVDAGIADTAEFDALYVLASFDVKRLTRDRGLKAWLRRVARHGATIAAIETACEVVAAAGLLDGRKVAVHWDNLQGFAESHPQCRAVAELYTASPGRLTCAGHSAILDMMLHGIAVEHGPALAAEIAAHLMLPSLRKGEDSQPAPGIKARKTADPVLDRALALMEKSIEEPIACSAIARRIGVTSRQLQRLFARELETTPVRHYQSLRLSRAHALLQQTDLSVTEIAVSAGFNSLEHFCRLYRRQFACRPRDDRRQSVAAPVLRRRA